MYLACNDFIPHTDFGAHYSFLSDEYLTQCGPSIVHGKSA